MIKKILAVIITAICVALFSCSCSSEEYSKTISARTLSEALKSEISVPEGEFSEYSLEDMQIFFSDPALYEEICIFYSSDATDTAEIGVISAKTEEDAKKLYEDAKSYIKNAQEQKRDFLRNYAPEELEKINSAEACKLGRYVVFIIAEGSEKEAVFNKAKEMLK